MVVKRKTTERAVPGEVNEWVVLGFLNSCMEHSGRITAKDWNDAIAAGRDELADELARTNTNTTTKGTK